ncbi:MAG: type IV pilus modification protein PilV [Betaproteobacteria bacterium]|nr:type IV pilus modification protein PilV [Betaproteobacteria bacterium]
MRPGNRSPAPAFIQSGASLLEILVTMVILALGLLGIAGMKLTGIKDSNLAYQYTLAGIQAQDMAERMGVNWAATVSTTNGFYKNLTWWNGVTARGTNCQELSCTTAQIAADDFWLWNDTNSKALPSGNGSVSGRQSDNAQCDTQVCSHYLIAVRWSDPQLNGALGWDSFAGIAATPSTPAVAASDAYTACGNPALAANRNLRCHVLRYRP